MNCTGDVGKRGPGKIGPLTKWHTWRTQNALPQGVRVRLPEGPQTHIGFTYIIKQAMGRNVGKCGSPKHGPNGYRGFDSPMDRQRAGPIPGNIKQTIMAKAKRIPDNRTFHFLNVNPKEQKTGDCVIRAVAAFMGWTWERTYREMAEHGIRNGWMLNSDENIESFLLAQGFKKQKQPRRDDRTKYTASEFCKELAKPCRTYLLRLAHHLTYVGWDSKIWDTWDCGYKTVGNWWMK